MADTRYFVTLPGNKSPIYVFHKLGVATSLVLLMENAWPDFWTYGVTIEPREYDGSIRSHREAAERAASSLAAFGLPCEPVEVRR